MAKNKNKNNTPRRKRYNRNARLQNAMKWMEQYTGKNIAKGYSNWFGVDLFCAIKELELLGYKFKESYKKQLQQSLIARQKQKERRKKEKELDYEYYDGTYYYVEGFTLNGIPDGIMDVEENEDDEYREIIFKNLRSIIDDEDLPF
ncbi:hypothetical protein ACIFOT_00910 [Neobacillus sp. NRS-1170]|uniref:hypothetical protein n=1 Tax=Neobacillus sp. NRS-1170 TaxID=3233898 RepID=UPI003D27F70C